MVLRYSILNTIQTDTVKSFTKGNHAGPCRTYTITIIQYNVNSKKKNKIIMLNYRGDGIDASH